jgi:hypothetical protein
VPEGEGEKKEGENEQTVNLQASEINKKKPSATEGRPLNKSGEQLSTVTTFITRKLIGALAYDGKWIVSTLKKYRSSVQTSHT